MTRKHFLAVPAICLGLAGCNGADSTSDSSTGDAASFMDAGPDATDSGMTEDTGPDAPDSSTSQDTGPDAADSSASQDTGPDAPDSSTSQDTGPDAPESSTPEDAEPDGGADVGAGDTSLDAIEDAPSDSDQSDAAQPPPAWVAQFPIFLQSLALTSDGGILVGGAGGGKHEILGQQVDLGTDWRAVVVKMNPDGSKAWIWTGPPGGMTGVIASSPTNEVCVLTKVASTPGTGTPLGFYKLSSDGTTAWASSSQSSLSAQIYAGGVAATADGACIFTGSFQGSLFGVNAKGAKGFAVRRGPVPGNEWTWLMPNIDHEVSGLSGVRVGADGTVFAGGFRNPGVPSAYVVALDSAGGFKWSREAGQTVYMGTNYVADLAVGLDRVWFGGRVGPDGTVAQMFLGAFDFAGTSLAYHVASGAESNSISSVAVDSKEHVWITGRYDAAFSFGGSTIPNASGSTELVIAELDKSGTLLSSRSLSPIVPDVLNGGIAVTGDRIVVQPSGRVVVLGSRLAEVDFGSTTNVFGAGNVFVLSYSP